MGLIAGIYSNVGREALKGRLADMLTSQSHRDKSLPETFYANGIALGMCNEHNMIFCDQDAGEQPNPRGSSSGQEIYAIVDGIVLDVPSHKEYFDSVGFPVYTSTCSAIVSTAYQVWGLDFMNHLEGDFSCAVWDSGSRRLILARDPYGHKPLHYYQVAGDLIFSSEIKGIIHAGVRPEIDLLSLSDYLSLNCIPCPATIFKNIRQVPPGTLLITNGRGTRLQRYWDSAFAVDDNLTLGRAVDELSDAIRNAVRKRMVADEVYCFLSGGIDSSALASFASELTQKSIHAVTVGFADEESNEMEDAELMARHIGAVHHKVIAKPESFFETLDTMVYHHDGPFTDSSAYPSFLGSGLTRPLSNVVITGDGPDQLMGGSDHYVFAVKHNIFAQKNKLLTKAMLYGFRCLDCLSRGINPSIVSKIKRKLHRESLTPIHAAYELRSYFPDLVKRFIGTDDLWDVHLNNNPYRHPESWFTEAEGLDDINRHLYADIKFYLVDDLMIKVDRMCMAHGLETMSPFLDVQVARACCKMPGRYKISCNKDEIKTKYVLREISKPRMPSELLRKKKKGFGIPLDRWLRDDRGDYLKSILLDQRALGRGYFKKAAIEKMIGVFLNGQGDYFFPNPNALVGLITLELCHRRYVD